MQQTLQAKCPKHVASSPREAVENTRPFQSCRLRRPRPWEPVEGSVVSGQQLWACDPMLWGLSLSRPQAPRFQEIFMWSLTSVSLVLFLACFSSENMSWAEEGVQ